MLCFTYHTSPCRQPLKAARPYTDPPRCGNGVLERHFVPLVPARLPSSVSTMCTPQCTLHVRHKYVKTGVARSPPSLCTDDPNIHGPAPDQLGCIGNRGDGFLETHPGPVHSGERSAGLTRVYSGFTPC
ncbi:hypothetical protein BaRGS_00013913 [Batillaria attramentaria]|uniref:Uncharacterized protein n=1 Tax=Batillaria attramentaria TaxID=370345 RepID=A0ABD0L5G6_9CAEN